MLYWQIEIRKMLLGEDSVKVKIENNQLLKETTEFRKSETNKWQRKIMLELRSKIRFSKAETLPKFPEIGFLRRNSANIKKVKEKCYPIGIK